MILDLKDIKKKLEKIFPGSNICIAKEPFYILIDIYSSLDITFKFEHMDLIAEALGTKKLDFKSNSVAEFDTFGPTNPSNLLRIIARY